MQTLVLRFVAVLFAVMCTPLAFAQAWPTKPVRMIVNFAAGGSTDVIARSMAPKLGEALGQQVVVENRVGAMGTRSLATSMLSL